MTSRQVTIVNDQGIHCRPSALIVKEFMGYSGTILVSNGECSCNIGSVMQLLSLELSKGRKVSIEVSGPDEEKTADRLAELFSTRFDFPPN